MKVLHVMDSGGLYGAERVLLSLMAEQVKQGIGTQLASIAEPDEQEKALEIEARRQGLSVHRHEMKAGPDFRAARELVAAARAEGFDLLHTHGYKANTLIAGMSRRKRGLPAVATLHGWTAIRQISRMGLYEAAERMALRRADKVIAVSHAMVDRWGLARRYGDRLAVIRNGIRLPSAAVVVPEALPPELASFIGGRAAIFAAGRLSREKGFDVLFEALARIRARGLDACLVLAGEGGEREALVQQAQDLGISDAVRMPGYLPDAFALMPAFGVVAIPSRSEGLPVVLLEALLAGVPVVATSAGEMPAVMGDCIAGTCVDPDSPEGLARQLLDVLSTPTNREVAEAASRRARERFSAEVMAGNYYRFYAALREAA